MFWAKVKVLVIRKITMIGSTNKCPFEPPLGYVWGSKRALVKMILNGRGHAPLQETVPESFSSDAVIGSRNKCPFQALLRDVSGSRKVLVKMEQNNIIWSLSDTMTIRDFSNKGP